MTNNPSSFAAVPPQFLRKSDIGQRHGCSDSDSMLYEAFEFVSICNAATARNAVIVENAETGERRLDVSRSDLHPAQEGALRLACEYIGRRFAQASKELPPVGETHG